MKSRRIEPDSCYLPKWSLACAFAWCLLTSASAFAAPLIELSDVAAGNGGFIMNGIDQNDLSGFSVSSAVNGDGIPDVIVGAFNAETGAGESYVVFGKSSGAAVNLSDIVAGTGGFVINGADPNENSGISVSGAGDVNGDGLDDLIIGATDIDPFGGSNTGRCYVVFGKSSGTAVNLGDVGAGTGGFAITGMDEWNTIGVLVSGAGDVNGDGLGDVIVGLPYEQVIPPRASGACFVVFGKASTNAVEVSDIAAGVGGFVMYSYAHGSEFGGSVSAAGDVNGDGLGDLVVGAPAADPGGRTSAGKSYVVFGKTTTSPIDIRDVNGGIGGFRINGIDVEDFSGRSVSGAGDVNGDGFSDVVIGAGDADGNPDDAAGESYVVFGKASTTPIKLADVATGNGGFMMQGHLAGDYSGGCVSGAGDVNGDGLDDVIIGALGANPGMRDQAGASYVVYGKTSTATIDLANVAIGIGGFVMNGIDPIDRSGRSVSDAGDMNGDGLSDLIIGAPLADGEDEPSSPERAADPDNNRGESYVVFAPPLTPAANVWVDFAAIGFQDGTPPNPYDNLLVGIAKVSNGGTINFAAGTTTKTITLSRPMTLQSTSGTVRIGVPPARTAEAAAGQSGFVSRSRIEQ